MRKIHCIIAQAILLIWFFLDMTGLYLGDKCLVTRSYKEDGIFFLIYLMTVILFMVKEKIGKWLAIGWMTMWLGIQFICHEWYTIFNSGFNIMCINNYYELFDKDEEAIIQFKCSKIDYNICPVTA